MASAGIFSRVAPGADHLGAVDAARRGKERRGCRRKPELDPSLGTTRGECLREPVRVTGLVFGAVVRPDDPRLNRDQRRLDRSRLPGR